MRRQHHRDRAGILARSLMLFAFVATFLVAVASPAPMAHAFSFKNALIEKLLELVSTPDGFQITAGDIEEPGDGTTELRDVELHDADGVWFKADALSLSWRPGALVAGRIEIDSITMRDAHLLRLPAGGEAAPQEAQTPLSIPDGQQIAEKLSSVFNWPRMPLSTDIKRLSVDRLEIAPELTDGRAISYSITGGFHDVSARQSLKLVARRLDEVSGVIDFSLERDFGQSLVGLKLVLRDGPGGLAARYAGLPRSAALQLDLEGQGKVEDWQLSIAGAWHDGSRDDASLVASLDGKINLDVVAPVSMQAEIITRPGPAMTPRLAELLGDAPALDMQVSEDENGRVALRQLALNFQHGKVDGSGSYLRASDEINLALNLDLDRSLANLFEKLDFKHLVSSVQLSGGLKHPHLRGSLRVAEFNVPRVAFDQLDLALSVRTGVEGLDFDITGQSQQAHIDRMTPEVLGNPSVRIRGKSDWSGRVEIEPLELVSQNASIRIEGLADFSDQTLDADYDLSLASIELFLEAYKARGSGNVHDQGKITGRMENPVLAGIAQWDNAFIEGLRLEHVKLEHKTQLGDVITGSGRLSSDQGLFANSDLTGDFTVYDSKLEFAGFTGILAGLPANVDFDYDLETDFMEGHLQSAFDGWPTELAERVGVPDIGLDIDHGRLDVRMFPKNDESGNPVMQMLTANLDVDAAASDDFSADQMSVALEIAKLLKVPEYTGIVSAANFLAGPVFASDMSADFSFILYDDDTESADVKIDGSAITLGGQAVSGLVAQVDLTDQRISAQLSADRLGDAEPEAINIEEELERDEPSEPAKGMGLEQPSLTIIYDASGDVALLDVALKAQRGWQDDLRLSQFDVTASGPLDGLEVKGVISGRSIYAEDFVARLGVIADANAILDARGSTDEELGEFKIFLVRYGANLFLLEKPAKLLSQGHRVRVSGLSMRVPGGNLSGDLLLGSDGFGADLDVEMARLSEMSQLFAGRVVGGSLKGTVDFDTVPGSANGVVKIAGENLQFSGATSSQRTASFQTEINWDGKRATGRAELTAAQTDPMTFDFDVPLESPKGIPVVPEGIPVDGHLKWSGRIGRIWPLIPAPGHFLYGDMDIDIELGGETGAIDPRGTLRLTNGRYENLEVGTVLTDLEVDSSLRPNSDGMDITLKAEDGSGNPVSANVTIEGSRLTGKVNAQKAVLVRRDDVTASASFDLDLTGRLVRPRLAGKVILNRVEARLADTTPPSVVSLGQVEILGQAPPPKRKRRENGLRLRLEVEGNKNIFARGRGLDSEWKVGLKIRGPAANPRIRGRIEKLRGRMQLIGREFTLSRGEIVFNGATPPNPRLDIELTLERNGIEGNIGLTGTADKPELAITSRPALPESEVLPRLLFNRTSQSMSSGEALTIATGLAALGSAEGPVVGGLGGVIDTLSFDTEEDDSTSLRVGKTVADGVYVGVRQPIDSNDDSSVEVEVEVFDDFSVTTEVGSAGSSSVGLNWRKDF